MARTPDFDRRRLLKRGLTVSAVGIAAASVPGLASAAGNALVPQDDDQPPEIFGCADWGARPANGQIVVENHKPTYILVHHTVDPGNTTDFSKERAFDTARAIQNLHMDKNGWEDTGQQFTNSAGGFLMEGRHRSLEILRGGTQHVQGAHVANHNSEALGIENEGDYRTTPVPKPLWDSLVRMCTYVAKQYDLGPEAIKGHRDFNSTECPGDVLYGRLDELRTAVGERLGKSYTPQAEWPLVKPGDQGSRVRTAQYLLRANGARNVPTDGVFGPSTRDAVAALASAHGIQPQLCGGTRNVAETGFLGSDIWPLLVRNVAPGDTDDATRAAAVAVQSSRARIATTGALTRQQWRQLLADA